jgi:hypothetical protein
MSTMRRAGLLFLCCLALVGCSSSGGGNVHKTLSSVVLQLSDFPSSWRAYPAPDSQVDVLGELAKCTGNARGAGKPVSTARSSEYRHGTQRITSMAVALHSDSDVGKLLAGIASRTAPACIAGPLRRQVVAAVPGATKATDSAFSVIEGAFNTAANVVGSATGTVTVEVDNRPVKVYVDVAFLTGAQFYGEITFIGAGSRIPDAIRAALVDDMAFRAQRT